MSKNSIKNLTMVKMKKRKFKIKAVPTPKPQKATSYSYEKTIPDIKVKSKSALLKELKANLINESEYSIKVLNETVYIKRDITILRIGHKTKIIEGNQTFLLLEKKVQEFMVFLTKGLITDLGNAENTFTDSRYLKADEKAFIFIFKKYPKVAKTYWLFAFIVLLANNGIELNMKRTRNIMDKFYKLTPKKTK